MICPAVCFGCFTNMGTCVCTARYVFTEEFTLTEEFCRQHYLVGLMLREVRGMLGQGIMSARRTAITILRDLLAKHELDDRYQNKVINSINIYICHMILSLHLMDTHRPRTPHHELSLSPASVLHNSRAVTLMCVNCYCLFCVDMCYNS